MFTEAIKWIFVVLGCMLFIWALNTMLHWGE